MSPESVAFLLDLISQQTVSIGHPDAEQITVALFKARRELEATLQP